MIKRLLCLGVIATMMVGMLTACNDTSSNNSSSESETTTNAVVAEGEYAYEQELNIIDDNYRNYYEIFVYSYCDSDGDGIGDLKGATSKLDYIADMGFNGIWLMPIMQSPTYHKYDVVDYYSIDEQYGSIDDFKEFVNECHERGINVIIDLVMNHSSSKHPWFKEACDYLKNLPEGAEPNPEECKYVEFYHFSKERPSATWYPVAGSKYYYEGQFVSTMPDLNVGNEAVRAEFEEIAKFWIDMGVDGFRMDAVMHFDEVDTNYNIETINWLYNYCLGLNPDFYMVSEVWSSGQSTIANYYASDAPSYFNFPFGNSEGTLIKTGRNGTATAFVKQLLKSQEDFSAQNPDYIDAPFITNHDMGRVANTLMSDPVKLKMTAGLLMTMGGSPFVYYGEEIGMKSSGEKDENKRLPMVWSKTDKTGITGLAPNADSGIESAFPGVDEQLEDEDSLLNYYKRAIRIRNENPEIARGEIKLVESLCVDHQAAITKTYEGSTIGIVYNTSDAEMTITLTGTELEAMGIRGYLTPNGEVVTLKDGALVLPAKSICFLK